MSLLSGARLGPYEILTLVGSGGMGEVYRARDPRLGREVAIKVLLAAFSADPDRLHRLEQEARAAAALNHPSIVAVHDIGTHDGQTYVVSELLDGQTLRVALASGALPVEQAVDYAMQIANGLAAAHEKGIVHRDLKPENLFITRTGRAKILDFGLAKLRNTPDDGSDASGLSTMAVTAQGMLLGTAGYMSPEQILGQPIDQRSDLFAFGTILYEMLTGHQPWRRRSPVETLHAILHDDAPQIPATSPASAAVAVLTQKLLRKSPAERYPSAEAVLEALASPVAAAPGTSRASGASPKPLTSIAVLPFVFLSHVEDTRALSLGFADALITIFGNLEDVVVAPTSAILNYAAGTEPAGVCRDLGVRYTLQGTVQKLGAHWRVSMQLFDATTHKITFSEKHDFMLENVFDVQDEIGRRVVESLHSRFPLAVLKSRDRYSSDPEAYTEFMAGLRESYSTRHETLESAVEHLSSAIERDPEFALAHAWLSYVSMNIYYSFDPRPARVETAEHHYRLALTIDPALPEANLARAYILWSAAKNFQHAEAIAALEQVLAAQPNSEQAHNRMSSICMHIGRFQEARVAHEKAQRANPKNPELLYLWSGDFARAEKAGEAWIRESPGNHIAVWYHPQPPLMTGDLDLAERRLASGLKLYPDDPLLISLQGMLHARRSEGGPALECTLRALGFPLGTGHTHHTYYQVASVYAVLGETDKAMAWLERTADTGFPCWPFFKIDPHLENLRQEKQFLRLVANLEDKYTALKIQRL